MNILSKNKRKVFIGIVLLVILVFMGFGLLIKSKDRSVDEYINLQILLLDTADEVIIKTIKLDESSTKFENDITIALDTNIETNYDVVLLNNYNQINFSINDLEYNEVHKIKLTKTDGMVRNKFKLRFEELNKGLNDCILVLDRKDFDSNFIDNKVYTVRFTVQVGNNDKVVGTGNFIEPIIKDEDVENKLNNKVFNESILLLDNNLNNFDLRHNNSNNYKYLIFNYESELMQSPFKDEYLKDKSQNTEIRIIIFALSDNKLVSISEENTINVLSKLKSTYLVDLKEKKIVDGEHSTRFFAVAYPFESQDNKLKSYKMSIWENILYV